MTLDTTTVIRVLDADKGRFEVQELKPRRTPIEETLIPYPRDSKGRMTVDPERVALIEAMTTANFPDLLRMGIQFDAWTTYNETPVTFPMWCRVIDSNKQQEEYVKDAAIGTLPVVQEGEPYPEVKMDLNDGVVIRNYKRGIIVPISEEVTKFDQLGKVREIAELQGRSARLTEEIAALNVLTTTANYTRTNALGDNDETATGGGANFQAVTFSATGLIAATNILMTMKDRKTGVKLGVNPDTLIVSPKLRWAAEMLIRSRTMIRQGGNTTNEVYGTGDQNPFFGMVTTIIVTPYFENTYGWALLESKRAITFQRVEPFQILQEPMDSGTGTYMTRDIIRYRVRNWFGVGMRDDRFSFLSTSSTAPTVG